MGERTTIAAAPVKAPERQADPSRSLREVQSVSGLQQAVGNQAMMHLLNAGAIQAKLRVSQPGDADEIEADRVAERIVSARTGPAIQRKCACESKGTPCAKCAEEEEEEPVHRSVAGTIHAVSRPSIQRLSTNESLTQDPAHPSGAQKPAGERSRPALLVDDEARTLAPGQMKKSQFMQRLRTGVCATADAALAGVGRNSKSCPYIAQWLGFYATQSADRIERALHKYAPEAAGATRAHDYLSFINDRVREAVTVWATTGRVTGVPPGAPFLPGASPEGAGEGPSGPGPSDAGSKQPGGSPSAPGQSIRAKSRDSGAEASATADPQAVRERLGSGRPLDMSVRSRMEPAFGRDFSGVRLHTDSTAAQLSTDLNARAFTIGESIAFASGEYKPGTLVGDALMAHELAHVVQQGGGKSQTAMRKGAGDYDSLEPDASRSAVGVMASLWGRSQGAMRKLSVNATPRLRSGLTLSRCSRSNNKEDGGTTAEAGKTGPVTGGEATDAGQSDVPVAGGNMANKKLSDDDRARITAAFKQASASGQVGAFTKDARFVLHDTAAAPTGKGKTDAEKAADVEKKELAKIAEHSKVGGTPVGEGPSSYVTTGGAPAKAHPQFFETDRPTATEFERGNDLMDKMSRESGMQKVWAVTDSAQQAAAIQVYLAKFSSLKAKDVADETKKAKKNLDPSQSPPSNDPQKVAVFTTASGAVALICSKVAAAGASGIAVGGKEKDLETACGSLSTLFAARSLRVATSTNLEIFAEKGSECSTDPKKAKPFPPYAAADYDAVAMLYLLAALEIGKFPEITTHYFLDKSPITKSINRCDPRCWDLGRLYATIRSVLGHPSGTTYGIDFIPGTTWGTSTVWWFDLVCGSKPGAKAGAPAGKSTGPPTTKT